MFGSARRGLLIAVALTAALAGTAHAEEPAAPVGARLAISASVAGGPYLVGAKIPIELTITNSGDADAVGVRAGSFPVSGSTLLISAQDWGPLSNGHSSGPAPTVPAGGHYTATINAVVGLFTGTPVARFYTAVTDVDTATTDLTVPLIDPATGTDTVGGLIYGDVDRDGVPDPGEGIEGVELVLHAISGIKLAKTDASGRFRFDDLSLQVYSLRLEDVPGGWFFHPTFIDAVADGTGRAADLKVRGVRPFSEQLSATMKFTKYVYDVGDPAEVALAMTNNGTTDLTGVKAFCLHRPDNEDPGAGLDHVDLGALSAGVDVPVGQTRTFTITGTVPPGTLDGGFVSHVCYLGLADDPTAGNPVVTADARVPATPDDLSVVLYHDEDLTPLPSEKLAGVTIGVVDVASGELVAKGRSDADGRVTFEDLPAAPYQFRVYGPWKFVREGGTFYPGPCRYCPSGEYQLSLVPGPEVHEEQVEVVPPPTTTPVVPTADPAPQPRPGPGLADTGADVLGLTALGALALLLGSATTLAARRTRVA
ncbi:hypothetical protein JOD54_001470 [Actinokineospora baliensis]|uniref:SdrD B-like domain-containing protein n=1 Tax=Actinokineospora baliensis TaxID=547056 RepID=UPI00195E3A96|nr:SdrD B-like domain-containing protein [Actinokineospora baliensis]MBM7771266.1 hypothetical protein [Actinokineospora baliensis]